MAIEKELLDQLLEGRDPETVFTQDGLLDELKKGLSERVLNAELGSGFSSPNQPDQVRTTAYHDGSGPDSRSDAHSAITVGGWEKQSGESRLI